MSRGSSTYRGHCGSEVEIVEKFSIKGVEPASKKIGGVRGLLDGLRDFWHVLFADGQILYVSTATTIVTGHARHDIVGRHIYAYIHPDDQTVFQSEFYDSILTGNSTRFIYRFLRPDGSWTILESIFYPYTPGGSAQAGSTQNLMPGRQVLIVARPYKSKYNALLDSFLEHTIVHERLLSRLQTLRTEEAGDRSEDMIGTTPHTQRHGEDLRTEQAHTSVECTDMLENTVGHPLDHGRVDASIKPRSSTVGDLGIPVSESRNLNTPPKRHSNKRSKKEPHVCMFCGTVNSPEWRKGPSGPKTLCNACGLRWAKSSARSAQMSSAVENEEGAIKKEDE